MSETTLQPEVSSYKQMQKESGRCTSHWKGDVSDHPDWMTDGYIAINTNSVENKKYMNLLRNKKQGDRDVEHKSIERVLKDAYTPKLLPADFQTYIKIPDTYYPLKAIYRVKNSTKDIQYNAYYVSIISKLLGCPIETLLVNNEDLSSSSVFYRYAGFKDLGLPPDALIMPFGPSRDTTKEIE